VLREELDGVGVLGVLGLGPWCEVDVPLCGACAFDDGAGAGDGSGVLGVLGLGPWCEVDAPLRGACAFDDGAGAGDGSGVHGDAMGDVDRSGSFVDWASAAGVCTFDADGYRLTVSVDEEAMAWDDVGV
jgi:hypothetical protein